MPSAEIDWLTLWRELAVSIIEQHERARATPGVTGGEVRHSYEAAAHMKAQERADSLLVFVLQQLGRRSTVLDIGAGSGRWTIPSAKIASRVTAIDPSDAALNILQEKAAAANLNNIKVVSSSWEEAEVEPHDVAFCVHGMYFSPDFAGFVNKMERHTKKCCYLVLRLPAHNGIIGELSLLIHGHRHDSPNFLIAYNALYSMGIYANGLVEDTIYPWVNNTIEVAFARAKRHLRLESSTVHDELIHDTLARRLTYVNGLYIWPDGMRSALVWWRPSP